MFPFCLRELNKRLVALGYEDAAQRRLLLVAVIETFCPDRQRATLRRLADEITSQKELF